MWFTLLIILDVYIFYKIYISLNIVLTLTILLVYWMVDIPESRGFKSLGLWEVVRNRYFNIEEVGFKEKKPEEIRIYAVTPHSVYASGVIFNFVLNPKYEGVVGVGTSLLSYIPICREFFYISGCVAATWKNIKDKLDQKKSIVLVPEGLRGLLEDSLLVLAKRRGFIECGLKSKNVKNITIVPVYIKNQEKTYDVYDGKGVLKSIQSFFLSKIYYPWPVIAFGQWFSFWPKKVDLTVYFGKPIPIFKTSVDQIRNKFLKQIISLKQRENE